MSNSAQFSHDPVIRNALKLRRPTPPDAASSFAVSEAITPERVAAYRSLPDP